MLKLLIREKEALLHAQLINNIIIHDYKHGEIELELSNDAEPIRGKMSNSSFQNKNEFFQNDLPQNFNLDTEV